MFSVILESLKWLRNRIMWHDACLITFPGILEARLPFPGSQVEGILSSAVGVTQFSGSLHPALSPGHSLCLSPPLTHLSVVKQWFSSVKLHFICRCLCLLPLFIPLSRDGGKIGHVPFKKKSKLEVPHSFLVPILLFSIPLKNSTVFPLYSRHSFLSLKYSITAEHAKYLSYSDFSERISCET